MATKHSQHYDIATHTLVGAYPANMTPQQYYWLHNRTQEQLIETVGRLRKENKRLKAKIQRLQSQQNLG